MGFQYSAWLSLPFHVRNEIARLLGIEKKGPTEVFNNQIKSDGYVLKELEKALSLENLQLYFNNPKETDYTIFWHAIVSVGEGKDVPVFPKFHEISTEPILVPPTIVEPLVAIGFGVTPTDDSKPITPKKRGRPSKQNNA